MAAGPAASATAPARAVLRAARTWRRRAAARLAAVKVALARFSPRYVAALSLCTFGLLLLALVERPEDDPAAAACMNLTGLRFQVLPSPAKLGKLRRGRLSPDEITAEQLDRGLGSIKPGVAIIAACKDKAESLQKVLPTWQQVDGVDEIVIVDWSSSVPIELDTSPDDQGPDIQPNLAQSPRLPPVRIVRVEGEETWVLTRAFNLAARIARRKRLLRVDCDYGLRQDFVSAEQHFTVKPGHFVSGRWENAHNSNEAHLNGLLYIYRSDFWKVGGYDERIQTYGFDDEDLYGRLAAVGIRRHAANFDTVMHLPHSDFARAQHSVRFVRVEIDYNELLLGYVDRWTASSSSSRYEVAQCHEDWLAIRVPRDLRYRPPMGLTQLVAEEHKQAAWAQSVGRRLHDQYRVPWDLLIPMSIAHREKLLRRLMRGRMAEDEPEKARKLLVLHAMHGLGNRLRALGSAMAFATATDRELVLLWETDVHVSAEFGDLYDDTDFVVISDFKTGWPKLRDVAYTWDSAWNDFEFYNYMEQEERSEKSKLIVDNQSKHIYYKGAFVMVTSVTNWALDSGNMRKLTVSEPVKAILKPFESSLASMGNFVGVHIRDRLLDRDIVEGEIDSKKEYGVDAIITINHWRSRSSYKNFVPQMRAILRKDPSTKFFLASDTVDIPAKVRQELPEADIYTIEGNCDARAATCLQYAVADLTVLSKASVILGSQWSSFTEAAQRLSNKAQLYLAGLDFAVAEEDMTEASARQKRLGRAI